MKLHKVCLDYFGNEHVSATFLRKGKNIIVVSSMQFNKVIDVQTKNKQKPGISPCKTNKTWC